MKRKPRRPLRASGPPRGRSRPIVLGTVGELRLYNLTLPGIEETKDPSALACLPVGAALKLLLAIFEKRWKLDRKTQAMLLKVSPSTLRLYHRGKSVPRRREQIERIEDLLRCYMALTVLFPRNPDSADTWLTRPNRRLRPSPVAYAARHGVRSVRRALEAELAW